ncbi:MAG: endonuclease III [Peptococcaceae bacterium]|nr:endonuclease III [Peptococcaceae bacterium]
MDANQTQILDILDQNYGDIGSGLNFHNPFELLVATILSAQSTDVRVNMVTPGLFAKYPTPFEMSELTEEALAQEINSIGLYRNKSKSIIKTSKNLVEKYQGEVPADREELQELPGVGRKTANVVLCNAFHVPAFAVDTHVFRVSQRLGFAKSKNVEGVEKQLTATIPSELWCDAHHLFIWHGRKICKAQRPLCDECCVKALCPFANDGNYSK